mmetsp:Transcript_102506/g.294100  ORF Transcript_102506/g.294100 Transcript_102506/m.294100 type:complete len:230 (+) Transcript_102506:2113-2802(+)
MHTLDGLCDDVRVLHGPQWDLDARHVRDGVGPGACAIHHGAGLDGLAQRTHGSHAAPWLPLHRVGLRVDALNGAMLHEPRAQPLGGLLIGIDDAGRVDCAVSRRVHGTIDVVHINDRVQLLRLRGREHVAFDSEVAAHGGEPLVLVMPFLVVCDEEAPILRPRVDFGLFLQLDAHLACVRVQLHVRVGGSQPPEHAGGVPGGACSQLVRLEQDRAQAFLLQVVGTGRAQ